MTDRFGLDGIAEIRDDERTRSITAENPAGAVGAGGQAASDLGPGRKGRPCIRDVEPGETREIAAIDGPGEIRHVWMTFPISTDAGGAVLRDVILRMYWDGEDEPSVEVPIGDFFCNGHGQRCDVNSVPMVVVPNGGFNCYLPMPFRESARIEIANQHPDPISQFFYQVDYAELDDLPAETAYLHAQWRRTNPTPLGEDHTILEAEGEGHLVGTYLAWTALADNWWGEGEVKCFVDGDEAFPTICGTGAEDYVGGAWCFGREDERGEWRPQPYSTPYLGYPLCDRGEVEQGRPPRHGLYRWHLPDPIRFAEDLRVTVQAIGYDDGLFERSDDVSSVAYWYQAEPHAEFPELPDRRARRPR